MQIMCTRYRRRSLRVNAYGRRYGGTTLCAAGEGARPVVRAARESARLVRVRAAQRAEQRQERP